MEKISQMFFSLWKGIFELGQVAMENKIAFGIVVTAITIVAIVLPFCVAYVFVANNKRMIAFILVPLINFMIWLSIEFGLGDKGATTVRIIIEAIIIGLILSLLEIVITVLLSRKNQKKQKTTQKKQKKEKRKKKERKKKERKKKK